MLIDYIFDICSLAIIYNYRFFTLFNPHSDLILGRQLSNELLFLGLIEQLWIFTIRLSENEQIANCYWDLELKAIKHSINERLLAD